MTRGNKEPVGTRVVSQRGYTIVEVMIFLAVSGMLFTSTMVFLAGRQQQAQFTNAVRDFETKLIDIANDVSNGYYQTASQINCSGGGGSAITIVPGSNDLGTNEPCIVLGRFIKLSKTTDRERYTIYSLAGKRLNSSGVDVTSLSDAAPKLLLTGSNPDVDNTLIEENPFGYGTRVACVGIGDSCSPSGLSIAGIAFVSKPTGGSNANTTGGSIRALTYYYPATSISLDTVVQSTTSVSTPTELTGKLTICLLNGTGSDRYALVSIGTKQGGSTNITSVIKEGGSVCS